MSKIAAPRHTLRTRLSWWLGKPQGLIISVRAYRWARSEVAIVKADLRVRGVETRATPPSGLAPRGHRGVDFALRRISPSCLERALVLQAWLASAGDTPDVVIGVRKQSGSVEAHAWVDTNDDPWFDPSYEEISRLVW